MRYLFILAIIVTSHAHAQPQPARLRFEDIARLVREGNPTVLEALSQVGSTRGRLDQAHSRLRPNLSNSSTFSATNQSGGQSQQGPIDSRTRSLSQSASLSQVIDLFGKSRAEVGQAAATYAAQNARFQTVLNDETAVAQIAYYDLAGLASLALGAQSDLKNADERLANTVSKFEAGLVPELNVLRAKADVSNYRSVLISRRAEVTKARLRLAQSLAMDPYESSMDIEFDPTAPWTQDLDLLPMDAGALVAQALMKHPLIQARRHDIRAAEQSLAAAKRSGLPSLSVGLNQKLDDSDSRSAIESQTTLSLTLSSSIFDGGLRRAQTKESQANLRAAEQRLTAEEIAVRTRLLQSIEDFNSRIEALRAAKEAVESATEAYRVAAPRYEQGLGSNGILEIQSAEASLISARSKAIDAYFGCLKARVEVSRDLGNPGIHQTSGTVALIPSSLPLMLFRVRSRRTRRRQ